MKARFATNLWVAVCDGRKAILLQNAGDEQFPKLETRETYFHDNPRAHEQGSDAPGRTFGSADGRRGAMEATDWYEEAEHDFVKKFAEKLGRYAQTGRIKDLVIAAPPRSLAIVRQSIGHAADCVRAEFDKDYVDLPVDEIERNLARILGE